MFGYRCGTQKTLPTLPHATEPPFRFIPSSAPALASLPQDEALHKMNPEKLRKLQPFFRAQGGSVTAGNSSPITDGAAAVVLASEEAVQRYGLKVRQACDLWYFWHWAGHGGLAPESNAGVRAVRRTLGRLCALSGKPK